MSLWGKLRKQIVAVVFVAVWARAVGVGVSVMLRYAYTPGRLAAATKEWPAGAGIEPAGGRATLIVFAHPQCPCSRATIAELAKIITCCRQDVDATVFFYLPSADARDWMATDLWRSAERIPGVRVMADVRGAEARRFGARTSGQTMLFDAGRRLVFNGGITAARGHYGDNDGEADIVALLRGQSPAQRKTPVFGCALTETD
ncbi:MAG: redB [Candidatus Solibacter sp.]|nr:redB [Candidatus Solibacter sp.]